MYASFLDESTLRIGNKVRHVRSETCGHHLCNDLGNRMDEAYGPKLRNVLCPLFLWNEGNICRVEPVEVGDVEG